MQPRYDCNCDAVICMEEMGVGTQEILQYAFAVFPRSSLRHLIGGLEALLDEGGVDEYTTGDESESPTAFSRVAT